MIRKYGFVLVAGLGGFLGEAAQRTGNKLEGDLAFVRLVRPVALEEVLVGVGGVELDQLDAFVSGVIRQLRGQVLGQVGLAGARRAVQDQLAVLLQQVRDLLQRFEVHVQGRRELRRQRAEALLDRFHDGGGFRFGVGLGLRFGRQEGLQAPAPRGLRPRRCRGWPAAAGRAGAGWWWRGPRRTSAPSGAAAGCHRCTRVRPARRPAGPCRRAGTGPGRRAS